ncbi:hypothetical protein [Frankia gtarii]|uniref:hypothetical protein n=1 Tax=Frankia gtarii TaxID=2950102 RepID=UPI0021BF0FC1|nr:hypothetical protein [Frankia gtarii]
MRLVPVASASCASANCPTVYVNDEDQDIFVQGYAVADQRIPTGEVPPGEMLVRIPRSVFLAAARDLPAQA